jgi:hypothetical protein
MPCSKNAQRRSRAPELALLALLALAACDRPEQKANAPADGTAPPAVADDGRKTPPVLGPSLAKPLAWAASASDEGNSIVLTEGGAAVLRISCIGDELVVYGERLKHVGSEERMSVGAGDIIATLVATAATDRNPPTVKGEGAIDEAFVRAVGEGRKIAVNYGYQNMGPYDGPPAEMAGNFVAACMD